MSPPLPLSSPLPEAPRPDRSAQASSRAGHGAVGLHVHLGSIDAWVWEDLLAPVVAVTTPLDRDQEPLLLLAERIADCLDADGAGPLGESGGGSLRDVGETAQALLVHVELAEDRGMDIARSAGSDSAEAFQYRRLRVAFLSAILEHAETLPAWFVRAETLAAHALAETVFHDLEPPAGATEPDPLEPVAAQALGAPATPPPDAVLPTDPGEGDDGTATEAVGETTTPPPPEPPRPRSIPHVHFSAPRVPLLYWLVSITDPTFHGTQMVEPHRFKTRLMATETREPLLAVLRGQWPRWPGFDPEDALPLTGAPAPKLETEPVSGWAITPAEWTVTVAERFRKQLFRFVHMQALERMHPAIWRDLVRAWEPALDDAMLAEYPKVAAAHPWEPIDAACWDYLRGVTAVAPTCPWLASPDQRMADILALLRRLREALDEIAAHPRAGLYVLISRHADHPNGPPPEPELPPDAPDPPTTDLAIPWQLLQENEP